VNNCPNGKNGPIWSHSQRRIHQLNLLAYPLLGDEINDGDDKVRGVLLPELPTLVLLVKSLWMPPWLRSAVAIKCTSGAKNRVQILLIKFS
jgi:hypothetical protein